MALPIFNGLSKDLSLLQTTWSALINPIINRRQNQSNILSNVALVIGSNAINHGLGRKLTGWNFVRQRALASVYDNQDGNQFPDLTLILISDAAVSCDIEVF